MNAGVVVGWIDSASRRAGACRALEALALACTTCVIVLAAAAISGASATEPAALAVATITAAMCASMWALERRRTPLELARRADRKLEQRGALVVAFETELDGGNRSLARALIERVASALTRSAIGRAVPWPSPLFAVPPLLAGALLALTLERAPGLASADSELLGRVVLVAASAARQASQAGAPDAEVERVLASARNLEQLAAARTLEREELARELAALATGLSELALAAPSASVELRAARDLGASALASIAGDDVAYGASSSSASTSQDSLDSSRDVANGSAARTMSRPSDHAEVSMNASSPEQLPSPPAGTEAGTTAGRWWPARYDAVVAEFTRRERDARR